MGLISNLAVENGDDVGSDVEGANEASGVCGCGANCPREVESADFETFKARLDNRGLTGHFELKISILQGAAFRFRVSIDSDRASSVFIERPPLE